MQKIGIICAMEEEFDSIVQSLDITDKILESERFNLYSATYKNLELYFCLSGIGKVNAAISTQFIVDFAKIDAAINVGVAGSLREDLIFGDVIIAENLVQHDVDATAFGTPLGQIPRMDTYDFKCDEILLNLSRHLKNHAYNIEFGRIVSGDQFIDSKDKVDFLAKSFDALACEMEGAAIAQACYVNKVPFLVVRALSDMAGGSDKATHSFMQLKEMSAQRSSLIVKQILDLL